MKIYLRRRRKRSGPAKAALTGALLSSVLISCILAPPAQAAGVITINSAPETVAAGDVLEIAGETHLPAGTPMRWTFGTEGHFIHRYFPQDLLPSYYETGTTVAVPGTDTRKWEVVIDTNDLKTGYYEFQVTGGEELAAAMIIVNNKDDGTGISIAADQPGVPETEDFYMSPGSKFVFDDSTGYTDYLEEKFGEKTPEYFASPYLMQGTPLVRGDEFSLDFYTVPSREIGVWLYSAYPDDGYRYFQRSMSETYTGNAEIRFGSDVTSALEEGGYYIFAEVAGRHHYDGVSQEETNDNYYQYFDHLPVTPEPSSGQDIFDPEGDSIESPASSIALDSALKAAEDEIKYFRFRIAVEDPWISIDSMDDPALGSGIAISGTTNFAEGTALDIEIIPLTDTPETDPVAWTGVAEVSTGTDGEKNWRTSVNSNLLGAGDYVIRVTDSEHGLTSDYSAIEITDNIFGTGGGIATGGTEISGGDGNGGASGGGSDEGGDSLVVRSYSVDPVSKEIVRLNEPAKKSPLPAAIVLAAALCAAGIAAYGGGGRRR